MPAAGLIQDNLFAVRPPPVAAIIRWRFGMTLTNVALWLVLIGLLIIIPCGCILTRAPKRDPLPGAE